MLLNNNSALCCVECFSHTLCRCACPSFWVLAIVFSHYAWDHPRQRVFRTHLYHSSNPEFHHLPTSLFSYSEVCYCGGALIASYTRLIFNDNVHCTSYTHTAPLRHSLPHKSIRWRKAFYNSGRGHASLMDSEVCFLPRCMASMLCRDHCHLFEYSPHRPPDHFASPHCALSRPAALRLSKQTAVFFSDHDFTVLLLVHPVTACVNANWDHPRQRVFRPHLYYSSNPEFHHLPTSLFSYSEVCYCGCALIASYTRLIFNDNVHRTSYTHTAPLRHSLPHKSIRWRKAYYNSGRGHASLMDSEVCFLPRRMASMLCRDRCHLFEYSPHRPPDHFASPHCALSRPAALRLSKQTAVFFRDHDFTVLLLVHPVTACVNANWDHPRQRVFRPHLYYSSNPEFHHLPTSLFSYSEVCYCGGSLIASYTRLIFNDNVHRTSHTHTALLRHSLPHKSIRWRKAYYNSGRGHASLMDSEVCFLPRCMASMLCRDHCHLFEYFPHRPPDHFASPHCALSRPAALRLNKRTAAFFSDHGFTVLLLVHPVTTCVNANYVSGISDLHASLSTSSEVCWCSLSSPLMHYTHPAVIHWVNAHSRFTSHASPPQCIHTTENLFAPALAILSATLHTHVVVSHTHVLPTNWGSAPAHAALHRVILSHLSYGTNLHISLCTESKDCWHGLAASFQGFYGGDTPIVHCDASPQIFYGLRACEVGLHPPRSWRVRCLGCTNMASHTLRTLMTYPQRLFWTQSHHELDRILGMPRMAHHVTHRCAMNPHLPCHVLKLQYSPWPLPALYPSSLPSPPVPFKRPCHSNRS